MLSSSIQFPRDIINIVLSSLSRSVLEVTALASHSGHRLKWKKSGPQCTLRPSNSVSKSNTQQAISGVRKKMLSTPRKERENLLLSSLHRKHDHDGNNYFLVDTDCSSQVISSLSRHLSSFLSTYQSPLLFFQLSPCWRAFKRFQWMLQSSKH